MRRKNILALTVALLELMTMTGCDGEKELTPVTVKGKVAYANGRPVPNMVLILHSLDDTTKSPLFSLVLDKEGRFQDSVLPGRYKATLAPLPWLNKGNSAQEKGLLSFQERKKTASSLPARYQNREQSPWEILIPETGKEDLLQIVQ